MKHNHVALTLAALMCCASAAGIAMRPTSKASASADAVSLETLVPPEFGEWRELQDKGALVVNPQTKELLDKLYSQLLTRTYVNRQGYRIMLSLAYGDDQRGGLQAHRPETCYPAQGFKVSSLQDGTLSTAHGTIGVRRLITSLGPRNEPVTYWLTVGDHIVRNRWEKRLAEIRLGVTGQIPDGMLFRISSIDADEGRAFDMQRSFTADLMSAVSPRARRQLGGLEAVGAPG